MSVVSQNKKIIFGLKVKQLRKQEGLSFQELSKRSGLSVSYLNEIEKGKKYPRANKITSLANALEVKVEELTSTELRKSLAPISQLINSDFLNELPLDLFGIEKNKVVEIIANSPAKVGAFISALLEISRKYYVQQEHFYFAALRSYQELHDNYFEKLEERATAFIHEQGIPTTVPVPIEQLYHILQKEYRYKINARELSNYRSLSHLHAVFVPNKRRLLLNRRIADVDRKRIVGQELAYNFLKIKERIYTSTFLKVRNFEEVLNHFQANYFAGAILIQKDALVQELHTIFQSTNWQPQLFRDLIARFKVSPKILIERLTNVLPKYFGLNKLFYFCFETEIATNSYQITKELHLTRKHQPHANETAEHYCRRWVSIWLIQQLEQQLYVADNQPLIGIQRSEYYGTNDQYLCITIAYKDVSNSQKIKSITLGLLIDEQLKEIVQFWADPIIPIKEVNQTCERCPILDCTERVSAPRIVEQKALRTEMQQELRQLLIS